MEYIGENLLPGKLGHLCIVLSFVAAILSTIAYFIATQKRETDASGGWRNIGRFGFLLHGLAVLGVIGTLFYILTGKMYEYQYAWANVSDDLPVQYVFSAFWKEQQGSFLLWSFWHIFLGLILIFKAGKWEAPVMATIALAEVMIAGMILGLYFGDFRLGVSPFDLLRYTMDAPIFSQPDYLSKIKGQGLNPLLQNYWMTIHPPTLFLGFASTIVPFAYALAGLWTRAHEEWLKPALSWALFSGAILGTGILMGGAWAYEALSFAGYWAWDPVENTSLVPWLTLVAGIHTNLVARSTGYSIRSTYGLYLLTFILILYSTYLTRSGILGDTSAHAFTEMGLGFQLILFIGLFSALASTLWAWRYREVPDIKKEESVTSREFWMFIGALVLLFSAVLITGATSLPVWNKIVRLFNADYIGAALKDPVEHHNRYQMWIAVFIGSLSGIGQFMRYKGHQWTQYKKTFIRQIALSAAVAAVLTALNATWINMFAWQLYVLLFAAMFAVAANLTYLISVIRGNLKLAGSAVSHIGFGALILGILSTGLNKEWISSNAFAMEGLIEGADDEALNRNVLLMRDAVMPIKGYNAVYQKDTLERQTRTFTVQFQRRDQNGAPVGEPFTLTPNVMYDREFSKVVASNPSTQHYWNYDIFTHVSSLPKAELDPEFAKAQEDSLKYKTYEVKVGDTIRLKKQVLIVEGFTKKPANKDYKSENGDLAFGVQLKAYDPEATQPVSVTPVVYLRIGKGGFTVPANISSMQLKIRLAEAALDRMFRSEEALEFTDFKIKPGESFSYKGYTVRFSGVDKEARHPLYVSQPGDVAVGAALEVTDEKTPGRVESCSPVFLIRNSQPFSLKDEVEPWGLHFKFSHIDPATGTLTISAARSDKKKDSIPLEIVEDAPRSDYIVLEAILFSGINLVWAGSILMLVGLAMGLWRRLTMKF